jgi:hypothetical protein
MASKELARIRKKAVVAYLKLLTWNSPVETEENDDTSGRTVGFPTRESKAWLPERI